MMSNHDVTKAVSDYVRSKGILITVLSEGTGISYNVLQPSIMGKRKLRADEFLLICDFLEVTPDKFWSRAN
jgi:lambda repressor-like predicted transcriptional regulator